MFDGVSVSRDTYLQASHAEHWNEVAGGDVGVASADVGEKVKVFFFVLALLPPLGTEGALMLASTSQP